MTPHPHPHPHFFTFVPLQAGFGAVDNTDSAGAFKNGTLRQLLADSTTKPHIAQVWDEGRGDFAVRDDVWIWMDRSDQDLTAENASWGPLTVGYGERDQHRHIGPELGFGMCKASPPPLYRRPAAATRHPFG